MKALLGSILSIGLLTSSSLFAAPPEKIDICHFSSDEDIFVLLNLPEPAIDAHLRNHEGDVLAPAEGETATNGLGVTVDSGCNVVVVEEDPA
jgi:hypothetical protein